MINALTSKSGMRRTWVIAIALALALTLAALTGANAFAQSLPVISITSDGDVTEGADAIFTVEASAAFATDTLVSVAVSEYPAGGFASVNEAGGRFAVFLAGETSTELVVVTEDDSVQEPRGVIIAALTAQDDYTVSPTHGYAIAAVSDNDGNNAPTVLTVRSASAPFTEGGTADFQIHATPPTSQPITVKLRVSQSGNFGAQGPSTITLNGGSHYVGVTTVDDGYDEPSGTVGVKILPGVGYSIGSPSSGLVTVLDDDAPGAIGDPSLTISGGNRIEEGGAANFKITSSRAPDAAITVNYTLTQQGNFLTSAGARTVQVTGATKTFTITTDDDQQDEADGSISVQLMPGNGYTLSQPSSASVDVTDNDIPEVRIEPNGEGGWLALRGERWGASFHLFSSSVPDAALTVNLQVDVTGDYGITPGAYTATMPVSQNGKSEFYLETDDDLFDEADGSVTVTVLAGSGYTIGTPAAATMTIRDDDVPTVSIAGGGDVTEGGSAVYTLTAAPPSQQDVTVTVDIATVGAYGVDAGPRQVVIPANAGSATLTLATNNDAVAEPDGSITATIASQSHYSRGTPSSASVAVADNDGPTVSVSANGDVTEGNPASFTVTASKTTAFDLTVNLNVETTGTFGVPSGSRTVTIPGDGATTSVNVEWLTTDDTHEEQDGTVSVTVQPGNGYHAAAGTATVAVSDDDDAGDVPTLTITADRAEFTEGDADYATFTITANPPAASALLVNLRTAGLTPDDRASYIKFTPGATFTRKVTVADDHFDDPDERPLVVTLLPGDGYTVGSPSQAQTIIKDNDVPTVTILAEEPRPVTQEGTPARFSLSVNTPPSRDLSIPLAITNIQGDFGVPTSMTAVIKKGRMGVVVEVPTVEDRVDEPNGSFTITLQDGPHHDVSPTAHSAKAVIQDDDEPSAQDENRVTMTTPYRAEPGDIITYTLAMDKPAESDVTVNYRLWHSGKYIIPPLDYGVADAPKENQHEGQVTIATGESEWAIRVWLSGTMPLSGSDILYMEVTSDDAKVINGFNHTIIRPRK